MSYTHAQRDIMVATNSAIINAAGSVFWAPGYQSFCLQAVAAVVTTTLDTAACVLTITKRVTAGSNTSEVTIDTLTIPNTTAAGKVVYVHGLDTIISPGDEIEIAGDGGSTAGVAHIVIYGYTVASSPTSDMILSA